MRKQRIGRKRRGGQRKAPSIPRLARALTGRSYAGQQIVRLTLPGIPVNLVNTVTTGVLAFSDKFDPTSDVEDWSTRFVNTFEEYRFIGVDAKLMASGTNGTPGVSKVWFDEKYLSTPGFGESTAKTTYTLSNSTNKIQKNVFKWRAADLNDLGWNATVNAPGNAQTAAFKVFTDNTHYNAPIVATSLFVYQPFYILEFRGVEEQ